MLPSFCRVTGNSRNLPKPNYFPLLAPISPNEARDICRSRGKTIKSLHDHQYVPVIEFGRPSQCAQSCRITQNETAATSYDPTATAAAAAAATGRPGEFLESCRITAKHQVNASYRYVYPLLAASAKNSDKDAERLKCVLQKMKDTAPPSSSTLDADQRFVYALDDDRVALVLPAEFEEAVRRGEIEHLLVAKDGSKTVFRLKNGPSVTLANGAVTQNDQGSELLQGNGQDAAVLAKQRKLREYLKRKASDSAVDDRRKFFEGKEREQNEAALAASKKKKPLRDEDDEEDDDDDDDDEDVDEEMDVDWLDRTAKLSAAYRSAVNLLMLSTSWRDLIHPKVSHWDWEEFSGRAAEQEPYDNVDPPNVDRLAVHQLEPLQIAADCLSPGYVPTKSTMTSDSAGFETVAVFEKIRPFNVQPPEQLARAVHQLKPSTASSSVAVKDLFKNVETIMWLPLVKEVGDVDQALRTGTMGAMMETARGGISFFAEGQLAGQLSAQSGDGAVKYVAGMMTKIDGEERFIVGQILKLDDDRRLFVPGRTATDGQQQNRFVPGVTVQSAEGAAFIAGFFFDDRATATSRFVAGRVLDTDDGARRFVKGQAVQTVFGPKFVPGETIRTTEGLKFAAGQTFKKRFVSGLVLATVDGPKFVAGQTYDTPQGVRFVAGQIVADETDGTLQFVAGQCLKTDAGAYEFVPGQTVISHWNNGIF